MTRKPEHVYKAQGEEMGITTGSLLYTLFSFLRESCLVSLKEQSESFGVFHVTMKLFVID